MDKDQETKGKPPVARTRRSRLRAALAALALSALGGSATTSCGIERPAIDLRQPDGMRKSFFVGANLRDNSDNPEFYMNNFVVASPADQSLVAVGSYDQVDRIVWEVQEGYLIGRKAYEFVTNRDGYGAGPGSAGNHGAVISHRPGEELSGVIVAAYRIESHFDVRYDYDPSTGQRLNRIIEAQDRPWYDREYMRVDWSQNIVDNPDWGELFYGSIFGDLSFQPLRVQISDPQDPNAPNFSEMDQGYFDVTSRWVVNMEMSNFFGEQLPTCLVYNFFSGSETFSCSPQETTIRTSFRRVDPTREFEPLEQTVQPYDLVGTPMATRSMYTQGYGSVDQNFHRYSMIHNVWDRSHSNVREIPAAMTALTCTSDASCATAFGAWGAGNVRCNTTTSRCEARATQAPVTTSAQCNSDDQCVQAFGVLPTGASPTCTSGRCVVPGYATTESTFSPLTTVVGEREYLRCNSNLDGNSNGTADQCEALAGASGTDAAGRGSQCDTVSERCTIPYIQRTIRPIAYYENDLTPAQMHDHCYDDNPDGSRSYRHVGEGDCTPTHPRFERGASEQLISTWDRAIYLGVAHAREVECRRTGQGTRDQCHQMFFSSRTGSLDTYQSMEDGSFLAEQPNRAWMRPGSSTPANEPRAVVLCHNTPAPGTTAIGVRPDSLDMMFTDVAMRNDSTTFGANNTRACREAGFHYRQGDIRFNHLTYWPVESRAPWGGIAHWGFDPLTGQVIANGATNMGRSVNFAATLQRDIVRVILSQLQCNGAACDNVSVDDWVNGAPAAQLAQHIRNPAFVFGTNRRMSDQEIDQRAAAIDVEHAASQNPLNVPSFGNDIRGASRFVARAEARSSRTLPNSDASAQIATQSLMQRLQGTPIEPQLLDSNAMLLQGFGPNNPQITQDMLRRVSPLRMGDPGFQESMRQEIERRMEARGYCLFDSDAPAMLGSLDLQGVARWFLAQYRTLAPEVRAQRILQDLQIEAYKGIALHELGHSLGLLHLPVSSYDSMNYNPQYWQLRANNTAVNNTATGAAQTCRPACTPNNPNCPSIRNADPNQDNCMGPRYIDPASNEELGLTDPNMDRTRHHAAIDYYANTSTMEYQFERFDETIGLGSYDMQAMGILYGRVIETMVPTADIPVGTTGQDRFGFRLVSQLQDQDVVNWADPSLTTPAQPFLARIHYTNLARELSIFDPATQCRAATPAEQDRYRWRLVNGQICTHIQHDYAAMSDMINGLADPSLDFSWSRAARVRTTTDNAMNDRIGAGQLRWRYRVAWDRGTGYPHINYFDQGADLYEVSQAMIRKYDLSYPTQYYRRANREWAWWGINDRVRGYFLRLRGYHWSVANNIVTYGNLFSRATWNQVSGSDSYMRDALVTGTTIFDFFQRVLLTPQPGTVQRNTDRVTPEMTSQNLPIFDAVDNGANMINPATDFNIGVIRGRYVNEDFNNELGGSLDYWHWLTRYGSSEEKLDIAIALTDVRPTFQTITRDLFLDARRFYVNFGTDMPQAFNRLVGGVLSADWASISPYVDRQETNVTMDAQGLRELTPLYPRLWTANYINPTATDPGVRRLAADGTTAITDNNRIATVFPNIGLKQQLGMTVFAQLFTALNTDNSTLQSMRIYVPGGAEAVNIPDAEQVRFTNPETGITYIARTYGADPGYGAGMVGMRTVDRGIAARVLQHAITLGRQAYMTSGNNPDGTPIYMRDAQGQLVPISDTMQINRRVQAFRDYVGLIDQIRNVTRYLGYGQIYNFD